jgi:hypothetical protein
MWRTLEEYMQLLMIQTEFRCSSGYVNSSKKEMGGPGDNPTNGSSALR